MHIHWFPGHMTKALRMMEQEVVAVDAIIYMLDARAPLSCVNPLFDSIIGSRPVLYILNKSDLVTQSDTLMWIDYFASQGIQALSITGTSRGIRPKIVNALKQVCAPVLQKYFDRGVRKTIRAMVIGIPNSGKSTLINSLAGTKKTRTANRPGLTRGKQWISIDPYIDVMDTPGTLYPDFSDQAKAVKLALIGSIREEIVDIVELASEAILFLKQNYPLVLQNAVPDITVEDDSQIVLEKSARARGFLQQGGKLDIERAARAIVNDLRKLKYGKVIFEKPIE